jgi:hypothetical protein
MGNVSSVIGLNVTTGATLAEGCNIISTIPQAVFVPPQAEAHNLNLYKPGPETIKSAFAPNVVGGGFKEGSADRGLLILGCGVPVNTGINSMTSQS